MYTFISFKKDLNWNQIRHVSIDRKQLRFCFARNCELVRLVSLLEQAQAWNGRFVLLFPLPSSSWCFVCQRGSEPDTKLGVGGILQEKIIIRICIYICFH